MWFFCLQCYANHSLTHKGSSCKIKIGFHPKVLEISNYSYSIAAESTASLPCSNVLIHCPICPKTDCAIWKYFMKVHFEEKHKIWDLTKYEHLWKLSNFEISEMKKIWAKRGKVTIKHTKKSENSTIGNIRQPPCTDSYNVCFFLLLQYKKWSMMNFSLSGDGETHLSRSLYPEVDEIAEPEKTILDKEAEESDFEGRSEDVDSVISVGTEEDEDRDVPGIENTVLLRPYVQSPVI